MLEAAGFCNIERVSQFNMFEHGADSSTVSFLGLPISLNIVARPCPNPNPNPNPNPDSNIPEDEVYFGHHATPYFRPNDYEIPEYDSTRKEFYTYKNMTLINENHEILGYELHREYQGYVFE